KADLGDAACLDMRPCRPHQLVLLPLHHERVGHFALEQAEVEHGDELAGDAVAKLKDRREQSAAGVLGKGFILEPELGQHFYGRRMDGGGALILGRLCFGLDQRDRDAFLDQSERHHRPHGAGADHDHPIIALHHPLQTIALYTPIRSPVTTRQRGQTFEISNIEGWNNSSTATLRSIRPCSWAYCVNAVISRMFSSMP